MLNGIDDMTTSTRLARVAAAACVGTALAPAAALAQAHTLQEALAAAYSNNPTLQAGRAALRATDENVPTALAGWRPTVVLSGSVGYAVGDIRSYAAGSQFASGGARYTNQDRNQNTEQATLTQPLYRGGRTVAGINRATDQVMSQRATLIATEQQVFSDSVNAFVGVIQNQQLLQLNINNEQVLTKQLQATNDRFRVGEITRTDVAQAEAALASATATRQTAEGNLATARGVYQRLIGELPDKLIEPQPLKLPTRNITDGRALAAANNPNVIAALYNNAAAKDNFDLQYAALLPNASLQLSGTRSDNATIRFNRSSGGAALANVTVPLFQGGSEYAAIRQARQTEQQTRRQVDEARRTAIQALVQAWETYQAARATAESTRTAIRANQIALEGVQREAIVGSRTTLDVLNAEQTLLNSRSTLVTNLANVVTASYSVAAATGRLTARDLALPVALYDETAYFNAVRDRWIGTGDYATSQPGR